MKPGRESVAKSNRWACGNHKGCRPFLKWCQRKKAEELEEIKLMEKKVYYLTKKIKHPRHVIKKNKGQGLEIVKRNEGQRPEFMMN